jgi:hypothetical protein
MNGVLFERFTQLLDKEQPEPSRKIYVIIDEFPTLCGDSRCPGVRTMFLRLRSRGAIPLIADQGESTLKPIYEGDTTALLGQCTNLIFLRQPDYESAQSAANALGRERGYEKKGSHSFGGGGTSFSQNVFQYDRTIVPEGDLLTLPLASPEHGIEGWAYSAHDRERKPRNLKIPPGVVTAMPKTRHDLFPEYIEREEDTQRLRPLTDAERDTLLSDRPSSLDISALMQLLGS